MRVGALRPSRGHGPQAALDRRPQATWRLGVGVVLVAGLAASSALIGHVLHEHPHRLGQEPSCVVCTTPLMNAAPALPPAPPAPTRPTALPGPPAAAPTRPAPLTFSPKQSPPKTRPG